VHERGGGLYYFNARWYDASTGRFTSEDPISDGVNWYAYVASNPLGRIDPRGLVIVEVSPGAWLDTETGLPADGPPLVSASALDASGSRREPTVEELLAALEAEYGTYTQNPYGEGARYESESIWVREGSPALQALIDLCTREGRGRASAYRYGLDRGDFARVMQMLLGDFAIAPGGGAEPVLDFEAIIEEAGGWEQALGAQSSLGSRTIAETDVTSGRILRNTAQSTELPPREGRGAGIVGLVSVIGEAMADFFQALSASEQLSTVFVVTTRVNRQNRMTIVGSVPEGINSSGQIVLSLPRPLTREEVVTYYDQFVRLFANDEIEPVFTARHRRR
jgi:hypothetical protein